MGILSMVVVDEMLNWAIPFKVSLITRPHPLMSRNGLVNQVKFLGLAHAFAIV